MKDFDKDQMLNYVIPLGIFAIGCFFFCQAYGDIYGFDEKIYIDETEMTATEEAFYLHQGDNIWFCTHTVHKDKMGTYTHRSAISCTDGSNIVTDYQKTWKCPYCYRYYPVGKPCDNKDCPSRYK